jgi:PAS domain S-box-containing protein
MMSWVCVNAQTQNTIVLQKETDLLLVGKSLYFLEDKEGKMTIEDVLKADKQGKFQHNDKDVFVRTNTPYKYWFKIVNQNKSKEDAWLEVGSTFMWNIDFYAPDSLQKYNKPIAMGSLRPYSNKLHNTNLFWFPLNRAHDASQRTYYLRMDTERGFEAPMEVGTLRSLYAKKAQNDFIVASFLGVVVIMILYNLFVYFSVGDVLYLWYISYLFALLFGIPFTNNYPFFDEWAEPFIAKNWWHTHVAVWISFNFLLSSFFGAFYLKLKERLPYIYWLVLVEIFCVSILIPIIRLLGVPHVLLGNIHQNILLVNIFTILFSSYYLYFKGYKESLYYSLGWSVLVLGFVVYALTVEGILPFNIFNRNTLFFASAIEIGLFALALGNRYNILKDENEKLVRGQNMLLEQKVQERTQDFENAQRELQAINEELQAQQEESRQNTEHLLDANENISLTLKKLERTQERLLESNYEARAKEEQLRRVINSVPSHLYESEYDTATGEMKTLLSSQAAKQLYDISEQEMREDSRRVLKAIHPEDLPAFIKAFDKVITTKTIQEITYRVVHKDGSVKWLHGTMLPTVAKGGKLLLTGIVNDITAQKEAEKLITYKGELLSAIASATDKLLKIDDWAEALSSIFRLMGNAVGVDRVYYFQNSQDKQTGKFYTHQKITWLGKDDSIKHNIHTQQDISFDALEDFFEKLVANKAFEAIISKMSDGDLKNTLIALDVKSVLILPIFVNKNFYGLIGFDDCTQERVWLSEEIAILQSLTANTATAIERSLADQALLASKQELKRNFEELQNTQDQLIESEKMAVLGQLIAGVAHEINNPLGAIKASGNHIKNVLEHNLPVLPAFFRTMTPEMESEFAKLISQTAQMETTFSAREDRRIRREWRALLEGLPIQDIDTFSENLVEMGLTPEQYPDFQHLLTHENAEALAKILMRLVELLKSTKIINTAVERASKIVFALKKFSHTEASETPSPTHLQETIETVLTLYNNQIKRGITLQTDFQEVPSILGFADELSQVWTNLIYNAMQAMDFNGTLEITIVSVGKEVMVSVKDSGKGIPPEIKEKVFEAFFTTKPAGEGTGLGLSITKKIIDKHQGRIEVESEVGIGTTFKIFFPIP